MDELTKQVRRARRRLAGQRFLAILGWAWFAALLAALGLIAAARFYPLGIEDWIWAAGALGLGLVVALVWTFATLKRPLEAALEIDRRFALKERVSSTLAMPAADRESEAGQALVADAARRLGRINVAEKFRLRPPRQILLPLAPAVLAGLLVWLIDPAVIETPVVANTTGQQEAKQVEIKRSTEILRQKLADRREKAEKEGLKDATRLLKKIEEGSRELEAEPKREKALVKLNDLARQLDARRKQLGGADRLKQQLEQLKTLDRGPADKLAQALSRGDFKRAAEELQKLKDDLAKGKGDDKQKEELAKQLDAMKDKLDQLAAAAQAAEADLQKRADQLRQGGQPGEADKLQEQIDKLRQQAPQMKQLQDLANQLGQCSKCTKEGKGDQAQQALQQAMDNLDQLQQQLHELEMLDGAMEQLAEARERMNCDKCGGAGCEACQGQGGGKPEDGEPGRGLGPGRGEGPRPEQKITGEKFYDTQVRQKVGKGAATVTDLVSGPNLKGKVEAEIQEQVEAASHGSTDPLSGRRLPKKHSEHAREYFDRFRDGK